MSKKKIKAPFYTVEESSIKSLYNDTRLPNGYLYAHGRNKTKITAADLPEYYIPITVYRNEGYISVKGIVDIIYRPNYHINHMHKDDHLRLVPINDAEYQRFFKNGILDEDALEKDHPNFWWRDGKELLEKLLTDGANIEIHNQVGLVNNSLMCDWAYVIDYDKNTFEIYRGFVKEPLSESERFYNGGYVHKNGYYPIRCTAIYSLDQLPSLSEFKNYDYENSYPYQDKQPVKTLEQKI